MGTPSDRGQLCARFDEMPGAPYGPPPLFFHEVCERWASGTATPYDTAVLTALTTDEPLAAAYDVTPVGFLPSSRLPPSATVHLFHAVKNEARVRHHAVTSSQASSVVQAVLHDDLSASPHAVFPRGLSAAPARAGLLFAVLQAFGAHRTVVWHVPLALLTAAGVSFCHALRAAGWACEVDVENAGAEGTVACKSGRDITDAQLARLAMALSRCGDVDDVIPGGSVSFGDMRSEAAVASLLPRLWLRARVAIGTRRRVSSSRVRKRVSRAYGHLPR